jgi:hypothetical protein
MSEWDEVETAAAEYALTSAGRRYLERAVEQAQRQLPPGGLMAHGGRVLLDRWSLDGDVPPQVVVNGRISRGDVFEIGQEPPTADATWRLFLATYLWGQGDTNYGPSRFGKILARTPRVTLVELIGRARGELAKEGAIAAYRELRGAGSACAAPGWGPAFFTKMLYFAGAEAAVGCPPLILDALLARQVHALTGMQYLVDRRGRAQRWSAWRYGVYLAWMKQASDNLDVPPDMLELSLFLAERRNERP